VKRRSRGFGAEIAGGIGGSRLELTWKQPPPDQVDPLITRSEADLPEFIRELPKIWSTKARELETPDGLDWQLSFGHLGEGFQERRTDRMSRASKLTLLGTSLFAVGTVFLVHYGQQAEKFVRSSPNFPLYRSLPLSPGVHQSGVENLGWS